MEVYKMATHKIFLDAGHGGNDGGAQGNGLSEKILNLKIVQKIESILNDYENVSMMLSRGNDKSMSLNARTEQANDWGANLFVSVHINAATAASANGFESFIYNGSIQNATPAFQNVMHQEIMRELKTAGVDDRGKKRANFHVLRESKMPAILTENLFISNAADAKKLSSDNFLEQVAQGHAKGIIAFLGLKKKAAAFAAKPETAQGTLYKVQIGAFAKKENADNLLKQAKAKGFKDAYITQD